MNTKIYGFVKFEGDIHTLGITNLANVIVSCGHRVFIGNEEIEKALNRIEDEKNFIKIKKWILNNNIKYLGLSYRLDPENGVNLIKKFLKRINDDYQLSVRKNGLIKEIYFAGLPDTCQKINKLYEYITTFDGDETVYESLKKIGIEDIQIPKSILQSSEYDNIRMSFAKKVIFEEKQHFIKPNDLVNYSEFGTKNDGIIQRIHNFSNVNKLPLMRAHIGPFLKDREKAILLLLDWLKTLRKTRYLDIVSIGSSQLSQSNFGEDWYGLNNGGGVPFNSELELKAIAETASPMLIRAYSGTKDILKYANMLERTINNSWHALSLWWFNNMDGRGPLNLKQSLKQQLETIKYVAECNKPYEPNTSHHFSFRGADDITYIISCYLAIKCAKSFGIKQIILQNMLNTPRYTFGNRDIIKSRVLLRLARELEDDRFKIYFQPRTGIDFLSKDINKAKIQLAAVTALMIDIDPKRMPEIIHVVSYSEGSFLATPEIIDDSIKITRAMIVEYERFRKKEFIFDIISSKETHRQENEMLYNCKRIIKHIEDNINDTYSHEGLFKIFLIGYLPVPYLWRCREEFQYAINWKTMMINGGNHLINDENSILSIEKRIEILNNNLELVNSTRFN